MTLAQIREQLVANQMEQAETTNSVEALTKVMVDRFKLEDRSKLDSLEDKLERKKGGGPKALPRKQEQQRDPFDFSGLLGRLGLPALVALGASLTGFDDAIKALRIPSILSSIRTSFNSIVKAFDNVKLRALNVVSFLDNIKLPDMPKLPDIPRIAITYPESWTKFGTRVSDAIRAALPTMDDIKLKIPKVPLTSLSTFFERVQLRIGNIFPSFDDIKLKLPTIKLPEIDLPKMPEFKFPDMPKFGLVGADGKPFKFPEFTIPDGLKNLRMPDFSAVTTVLKGADGTGGVLGFFSWVGDMVARIPGLRSIARLVGGPITQAIISVIDFFVGFYKGFTEVELDADGNEVVRSISDKILGGLEGGLDGVLKGIVDAFQLVLVDLPSFLLNKMGVDTTWLDNVDLWSIVSPLWEFIKGIPKFIFSKEYRDEQIARLKTEWEAAGGLAGIFWTIWDGITELMSNALDGLPSISDITASLVAKLPRGLRPDTEEEKRADAMAARLELQEKIDNERERIARSEAGSNEYTGFEGAGRQRSQNQIAQWERLLNAMPELSRVPLDEDLAIAQAQAILNRGATAPQITQIIDNSSSNTQNSQSQATFASPASTVDTSLPATVN